MEDHHPTKIFLSCIILFHHLFYLVLTSSAYTPPDHYFIDCGSTTNTTVNDGRIFISDLNSGSFTLSAGESSTVEENPPAGLSSIYHTARIFRKESWYELDIDQNGTYVVRLHFYPLTVSLNSTHFDVSTHEFKLLSNFSIRDVKKVPNIQEFLLSVNVGKFRITFTPSGDSSLAFVNAIEAFLAPETLVRDSAPHVTPTGSVTTYNGSSSTVLHVVHRINVGGTTLTPENDTLWRNWVPDDDYLFKQDAAKNFNRSGLPPNYEIPGATGYDAPDPVYNTAKELNVDTGKSSSLINITWRFNVSENASYRVRVHFCDIITLVDNDRPRFKLYIYRNFSDDINTVDRVTRLAVPFYIDYVVDSDDSGFMSISVGPGVSGDKPFLNGVEIMKLMGLIGSQGQATSEKNLIVIIAPVAGGVTFIFICVVVLIFVLRRRRKKPVEADESPLVLLDVLGSHGGSTERTANVKLFPDLELGLKLPFADIQSATKNFDKNLVIGEGGFGKVYKGILPSGVKVAVKRSEPGHGQGLPEFQTEINLLSGIRNCHLVSLIGYCDEGPEMILVYEYMEKGTLRDHLYKLDRESYHVVAQSQLSWQQRLEICIGAAKGLQYLHNGLARPIIHRDVKSTNILLDQNHVAKVSDFGLSRSGLPDETHISTDVKGSFGYLDPEYFKCLQLTQKSDVYSFGVVLLEVLCARPVINHFLPREQVNLADWGLSWIKIGELEEIIDPSLAGRINPNSLRKFGETIEKCLEECGIDRPNIVDVLWNLEYAQRLQMATIPRQTYQDSTTDASLELPFPVLNRLPSHMAMSETGMSLSSENTDSNYIDASQVFSQLKMDEAR